MEKLKTILPPLAVLVALSGLWWLVVVQTESEVRIDDMVRTGPDSKGIVISQHGSVFPWLTVRQNLMFGLNGDGHGDKKALVDNYGKRRSNPLKLPIEGKAEALMKGH
jgi:ABC-type taurine transport system ATPase subunit